VRQALVVGELLDERRNHRHIRLVAAEFLKSGNILAVFKASLFGNSETRVTDTGTRQTVTELFFAFPQRAPHAIGRQR